MAYTHTHILHLQLAGQDIWALWQNALGPKRRPSEKY